MIHKSKISLVAAFVALLFCFSARAVSTFYLNDDFLNTTNPIWVPPGNGSTTFGITNVYTNLLVFSAPAANVGYGLPTITPALVGALASQNPVDCPVVNFSLTCQQFYTNIPASNALVSSFGQAGTAAIDFAPVPDGSSKQAGIVESTNLTQDVTLATTSSNATTLYFTQVTTNFYTGQYITIFDIRQSTTNWLEITRFHRGGWTHQF